MKISLWKDTEDEKIAILDLTKTVFGDSDITNSTYFDWQYRKNPNGKAIILLAYEDSNNMLIGTSSILPLNLVINGEIIHSSLACNVQVHPDYRKKNIFSNLLSSMPNNAMDSSIYSLFAIPNDNSFKAFINEGSTEITRLPLQIKPIKLSEYFNSPLKQILKPFDIFWKNTKNFPQIEELHNNFDDSFDILLEKTSKRVSVINNKTKEFLNWRYKNHPTQNYRIFILKINEKLVGYIIIKIHIIENKKIGVILDYMVDSNFNNKSKLKNLIYKAISVFWENNVSVAITISRNGLLENSLLRDCGFLNCPSFLIPVPLHFIVQTFNDDDKHSKLKNYHNWFFTFGDYDVF